MTDIERAINRGIIAGTAQCLLLLHYELTLRLKATSSPDGTQATRDSSVTQGFSEAEDMLIEELQRILRNNAQLHSASIGDPILMAATILTMMGQPIRTDLF